MAKTDAGGVRLALTWLIRGLLVVLIGLFLLFAVGNLIGALDYLGYIATEATVFDTWALLSLASLLLSAVAIVGAGMALWRRRLIAALGLAFLSAPAQFVIEGSRCDMTLSCQIAGWAALPREAFGWDVRLRPIADSNEATGIASAALRTAGIDAWTHRVKRFDDHWIVSAITDDGRPAPKAVRIDTRSAQAVLIPCPADRILCDMEQPTVSDGRTPYRNDALRISAVFPASRPVCASRGDDDAPRGFASSLRSPDIPCEVLDGSREMGLEIARSRKDGCRSMEPPPVPWRPLSAEAAKLFRNQPVELAGRPSLACELRQDDQIQISVYVSVPSGPLYEAYIVTTPAHLAEDVRSFERFLESARIGPAAGEAAG